MTSTESASRPLYTRGERCYELVVLGGSAGGIRALSVILRCLPETFFLPLVVVLHRLEYGSGHLCEYLGQHCVLPVLEVEDKQVVEPGRVYIAPAGYHLLLEPEGRCSLSVDPKVSYSRPSIDVLFESAVDVYKNRLVAIILTGANSDGSNGLRKVSECAGLTIVQRPDTAVADFMPKSALRATGVDKILNLEEIGSFLAGLP
jgi:two-component system, chemotaxis family, protein-glutamate methylesterase/glutaminase